jgi:prepilin-type N-terminal cleavage/methylation domain-containing protein
MKNKKLQGFTLIELLIVIGIIAILAGIVLVAVNPAQQFGKANDAERKSELGTILSAVYQFQTAPSARGALPDCGTDYAGAIELGSAHYDCDHSVTTLLVPSYLREIPVDPASTYDDTATGYWICQTDSANPSTSTVTVFAEGAEVFTTDGDCQWDDDGDGGTTTPALDVMCVGS